MTEEPTTPEPAGQGEPEASHDVPAVTAADVDGLFRALDDLCLPPAQHALLGAILRVAADLRDETEIDENAVDERPFSEQFASSFKITQAERVLAYAHGAGVSNVHTDAIHRSLGPFAVTNAAIHRAIHRDQQT